MEAQGYAFKWYLKVNRFYTGDSLKPFSRSIWNSTENICNKKYTINSDLNVWRYYYVFTWVTHINLFFLHKAMFLSCPAVAKTSSSGWTARPQSCLPCPNTTWNEVLVLFNFPNESSKLYTNCDVVYNSHMASAARIQLKMVWWVIKWMNGRWQFLSIVEKIIKYILFNGFLSTFVCI